MRTDTKIYAFITYSETTSEGDSLRKDSKDDSCTALDQELSLSPLPTVDESTKETDDDKLEEREEEES